MQIEANTADTGGITGPLMLIIFQENCYWGHHCIEHMEALYNITHQAIPNAVYAFAINCSC